MMETDLLLMDDVPSTSTLSQRRTSGGILGRSSGRHVVHDSSDEDLLDVDLPSPVTAPQTNDIPHGTDVYLFYRFGYFCICNQQKTTWYS